MDCRSVFKSIEDCELQASAKVRRCCRRGKCKINVLQEDCQGPTLPADDAPSYSTSRSAGRKQAELISQIKLIIPFQQPSSATSVSDGAGPNRLLIDTITKQDILRLQAASLMSSVNFKARNGRKKYQDTYTNNLERSWR